MEGPSTASAAAAERGSNPDLPAQLLKQIEDLVSDGSLVDALNVLQDLVRDFARDCVDQVLILRERHETARKRGDKEALTALREQVLKLAEVADERARKASDEASRPARATADGGARAAVALPPEELRRRHFELYWNDPASIAVEAKHLRKAFTRSGFSLGPLSFRLRLGEITGVVGRNASGKTTLLRLLMGELRPDAGEIAYPQLAAGRTGWTDIKRQIAYVPQLPEKWHGVLRHNLNFMAAAHAAKGQDPQARIDWCVSRYDLKRYENSTWDEISGGYKMRFELVCALIQEPRLLILDEPLAYLDVIARQRFLTDLQTIATAIGNPVAIVVTSQHLSEIEAVANQMIFIDDGVPRYVGTSAGIAAAAEHRAVEISLAAGRDEVALALDGMGLTHVQRTMEGFLLTLPLSVDLATVFQRLRVTFADRFTALRDVTASARSLMTEEEQ